MLYGMSQETFFPEQTEAIRLLLKRIDHLKSVEVVSQASIEISSLFKTHPFMEMEKILREIHSDTYLIAVPLIGDMAGEFSTMLPHSQDKEYPYYLWICVNGEGEAREKLLEVETNPARNMVDLGNTGLLVPRRGTPLSQMVNARNN
jgi:hypothetical protein